jgi:hypothetical protein
MKKKKTEKIGKVYCFFRFKLNYNHLNKIVTNKMELEYRL